MIPPLVLSAHEECWRVPSQYRLSNALYGDAYHPALSGVAGAAAAPRQAAPAVAARSSRRRAGQAKIDKRAAEIQPRRRLRAGDMRVYFCPAFSKIRRCR